MRVVRTQWPVGQGCFSTGIVDAKGRRPFHYVYDCGARNVGHLEPIVENYADRIETIDALFVSHLDGDHVDGLDRLLARSRVKTVYLPYLDIAERVIAIAEDLSAGRLNVSLMQAQLDPAQWFISRGAERVVFVRNDSEGPTIAFTAPEPPESPEKLDSETEIKPVEPDMTTSQKEAGVGEAPHEQIFEMQVGAYASFKTRSDQVVWLLVPYVPPVDQLKLQMFRTRIATALGVAVGAISPQDVINKLKTGAGRDALRACYDAIVNKGASVNHNKVSMSLYSGPASANLFSFHRIAHDTVWRYAFWDDFNQGKTGWIGAGDAKLKDATYRNDWEGFYGPLLPKVSTFLLPHHGSKANWHPDLLHNVPAFFFVAAADASDKGYKHPSQRVVDDIEHNGRSLIHVSKRQKSRFLEIVATDYALGY